MTVGSLFLFSYSSVLHNRAKIFMPDSELAHRDSSGKEYYRERSGNDERLVKKRGNLLPVIGAVVAIVVGALIGSR